MWSRNLLLHLNFATQPTVATKFQLYIDFVKLNVYNDTMNTLASNLSKLRKSRGLTQEDLAKSLFVTRQAVSKWERGDSVPDLDLLLALSEMYSISLDDLLKKDISPEDATDCVVQNAEALKRAQQKKTAKSMLIWGVALVAVYALVCGIIHSAVAPTVELIWLVWFTLPIVPPVLFALRFRHEIGKAFLMYFVDVPFVSGLVFLIVHYTSNAYGAWLSFLLIPIYYSVAVAITIVEIKKKKKANN